MEPVTPVDLGRVAQDLQLKRSQVESVVQLLDEANTVPFITRYRKERTGNLDEESIRKIQARVAGLRQLAERKLTILRTIEGQGKLTDALRTEIQAAENSKRLEDLYLPYKPRKRTLATVARERGLEPLADAIWNRDPAVADLAAAGTQYVSPEKELPSLAEVQLGVQHILAERISEIAQVRDAVRRVVWKTGRLAGSRADIPEAQGLEYKDYFQYTEPVGQIPPHRTLALNRGESVGALKVKLELDEPAAREALLTQLPLPDHPHADFLKCCALDALSRLVLPSLEREVRRELTDWAEDHAVTVFARNLRSLLLQPPIHGKRVLAVDPGFRTGCKLAVLDEIGKMVEEAVIFPHQPQAKRDEAKAKLHEFATKHGVQVVAVGNGTACRETEELVAELIAEQLPELAYVIVNEAGASHYSTSAIGREEFPEFDATLRGTISIGRRLQDPLSELVKIDPQNIGVGLYQHDVNPRELKESLDAVIESCVNYVGVDLNTASVPLLRHVSGLNQLTARRVVDWRKQHGAFTSREQLKDVQGIGDAVFTQAAGFLKITGGTNPLDRTWIHPETYPAAERLLEQLGFAPVILEDKEGAQALREKLKTLDPEPLAAQLAVGVPTMRDMLDVLARPGRDPREDLPTPIFKKGVLKLEDLQPSMELKGTVLNVVDFGAFVDIGLKDSGLVHISQMANRYVKTPHDIASVGDVVTVWVLTIDQERRRVSLSMIKPGTETKPQRRELRRPERPPRVRAEPSHAPPPTGAVAAPGAAPAPATLHRRAHRKPHRKKSDRHAPLGPLAPAVLQGIEPARSFGELKRLWEETHRQ